MRPTKVLVVDDSKLTHTVFLAIFPEIPMVHAMDGLDALDRLGEHPGVDLIFLDLNMPRMNGLELLDRLKADVTLALVPVVIFGSEGKEQDTVRGLRKGATAYIKKPLQIEAVRDLVNRLP